MTPRHKLYTTGDVARMCGFSPSAVLQWIRTGKLEAYTTPGGQNRIEPDVLLAFLEAHGMRVPSELRGEEAARILIVDDEELCRQAFAQMLEASDIDCVVDTAENGIVGCMKIPLFGPDLILLDLVMPQLDGIELCRTVKDSQDFEDVKVLVMTGYPHDERLEEALAAGADGWLAKPVTCDRLTAEVRGLLPIPRNALTTAGAGAPQEALAE